MGQKWEKFKDSLDLPFKIALFPVLALIFCVKAILRILAAIIDIPARGVDKLKEKGDKGSKRWYVLYAPLRLITLPLSLVSFVLNFVSTLFEGLEKPILTFARPILYLRGGREAVREKVVNYYLGGFDSALLNKANSKLYVAVKKIEHCFDKRASYNEEDAFEGGSSLSDDKNNSQKIYYEEPNNDQLQTHFFPINPLSEKHFSFEQKEQINNTRKESLSSNNSF